MKKTGDGNNQKPVKRDQDHSAARRSVSPVSNSAKAPSNASKPQIKRHPVQRPVQSQGQRTTAPAAANRGQKNVQRTSQKPSAGQPQRPSQRLPQKPAQRPVQKPVQQPLPDQIRRPVKKPAKTDAKKLNLVPLFIIAAAAVLLIGALTFFSACG